MKTLAFLLLAVWLAPVGLSDQPIVVREIQYTGTLAEHEARFAVVVDLEVTGKEEVTITLFEGDVAVLPAKLPSALRLVRDGQQYRIVATRAGRYRVPLEVVARIIRQEPWNLVKFTGPEAAIAGVTVAAQNAEVQLLAGTVQEAAAARVRGFLGADRQVAVRWQSRAAEVARTALVTAESAVAAQVTPTVVKYTTHFRYEILQGNAPRLVVALPAQQTLTKLQGEGVRDWVVKDQLLKVEFVRPVEKTYALTLWTEQPVEGTATQIALAAPQPVGVERETGTLTVAAEDVVVETDTATGLRQMNATGGALAAYQFYARPFALTMNLRRIEPVVTTEDRVTVRVEEARLAVTHAVAVTVERAGIYALELPAPSGWVVADVRGEGIEDWRVSAGQLAVTFSSRLLGVRKVEVQLEQALKALPDKLAVPALRVTGATRETGQIGVAATPGLQLKTATEGLTGVREIPVNRLGARAGDEVLAYQLEAGTWQVILTVERLASRITADIFNLVTVGDGLLGGSATIRYAILNQGVQEFRVAVPERWKNVEFTGPNIRRKEQQGETWVIGLQEKAWGGYTLVVTYDYQFDPHQAALAIGGIHCVGVERETGHIAVTSAANLQIREAKTEAGTTTPATTATTTATGGTPVPLPATTFDRVDEMELPGNDRALITRPVLLAHRYAGTGYQLNLEVTRFEELPVLDAAADRTQLTTVLTDAGQLLSQASFMVKNNDRQFQTFTLPAGAELWSCWVAGAAVKPERNGDRLLVPLPRRANRDEAFAVDIVYAQTVGGLKSWWPRSVALAAPETDMQTTYAEWELYVPREYRLGGFAGNMTVARGTTYGWRDAWQMFADICREIIRELGPVLVLGAVLLVFVMVVVVWARRGFSAFLRLAVRAVAVLALLGVLGAIVLPAMRCAGPHPAKLSAVSLVADESDVPVDRESEMTAPKPSVSPMPQPLVEGPGQIGVSESGAVGLGSAMVAGIRPLRIEIPKEGQRFTFTKVLNVGREPLRVEAVAMEKTVFATARGFLQIAAFVIGLGVVWWQWRRVQPNALGLAIGLALAIGAVGSVLLAYRILHLALVGAVLVGVLLVLGWGLRQLWRNTTPTPPAPPPIPPAVATLVLLTLTVGTPVEATSNAVSILSANYTGAVRALDSRETTRVGEFSAVITLNSTADNQTVRLFGADVAVQDFSASPTTVKLVRESGGVNVVLPRKGPATVRLKFLVQIGGDATRRQAAFGVPAALSSRLSVTLDEAEAQVEAPTAVSLKTTAQHETATGGTPVPLPATLVEAVLGAAERVELNWTPRMKRAAEVAMTVFCNHAALVAFGNGVVNVRSVLDYQVLQGEVRLVRVGLPAGHRLMRVDGDQVRTWKVEANVVTVEFVKAMTATFRLTIESERLLEAAPVTVAVETPRVLDVNRETGLVGLASSEELALVVTTAENLQKVDVAEFAKSAGASNTASSVYRFLKPEFGLTVQVEAVQPQVEAVVFNHVRVEADQMMVQAQVDYTIKRAGVFQLRVAVPAGFTATAHAPKMAQWSVAPEAEPDGTRIGTLTLRERTLGAYTLNVSLRRAFGELPKSLPITGVRPLDTQKLTGFVTVTAEEGVQLKSEQFTGVSEVPAATVAGAPAGGGVLAYKLITGETPGWDLAVTTEKVEAWVRAEVLNTVTLGETLVSGRSEVRFEIVNAPTKELRIKAPATYRNVELSGANIRRKDHNEQTGEWRVELQNKVRGSYVLTVTWEQPWDVAAGGLEVAGVEALGVERETGAVAIHAPARLRVATQATTADLLKVDPSELPEWGSRSAIPPVVAYRYLRPGFKLGLRVQRFEEAAVLQALVDNARLTTVVAEDGQMMTELALAIRNHGRQYLELTLPAGAQVWSAFVAGQPVRPTTRAGKVLLPLERSADDAPVAVEVTYVGEGTFPRRRGAVRLEAPALDVPLKNARWDLYVPPDYRYGSFAGTMTPARMTETRQGSAGRSTVASFTLRDYAEGERLRVFNERQEVQTLASNVKAHTTSGNLNDANKFLGQVKKRGGWANEEVKKLEADLQRRNADNYLQAQQEWSAHNATLQGGQALNFRYDAKDAEQQVAKVQAAQEVAVAKALPLRVSLPKRGMPLVFTQVLQTEPGKPMVVQFAAVNDRATGWPTRVLAGGAAFLVLWAMVAGALMRRRTEAHD
jgi:hypothetical protein